MKNKIAVIGYAARLPKANTIKEFRSYLEEGKDCVEHFSLERLEDIGFKKGNYVRVSQLSDISKFDNEFFGVSMSDALMMDPAHRIMLETVYHCIENAAIPVSEMSNTNTAIFLGSSHAEYHELFKSYSPGLLAGNLPAIMAGRIARFYNLKGNAMMVDTACSSSLVAIHQAVNELLLNECDMAFAGGAKLNLFPTLKSHGHTMEIFSDDDKTYSFSDTATGTGSAEAAGVILLKRYDEAIRDNNPIHAVILATAVNQDANSSVNLLSPSAEAQAEVLVRAWEKAGINPLNISYIEGHGTGTKIGDPIEVEGLNNAFQKYTDQKSFCALSSIKSNIGHADSAAGICGVLKGIISIKSKKLFPIANFNKPNPLADFENSPVYPIKKIKEWTTQDNVSRLLGVSAFSLSGTNCHVLLEDVVNDLPVQTYSEKTALFCLSAKSDISLKNNINQFLSYVNDLSLDEIHAASYTYNTGKDHYKYRVSFLYSEDVFKPIESKIKTSNIILCIGGKSIPDPDFLAELGEMIPTFKAFLNECNVNNNEKIAESDFMMFSYYYALTGTLKEMGVVMRSIMGVGIGKYISKVLLNEMSVKEALNIIAENPNEISTDFSEKLTGFINKLPSEKYGFIDIGGDQLFTKTIKNSSTRANFECYDINKFECSEVLTLIGKTYLWGGIIDFKKMYRSALPLQEVPEYAFVAKKIWPKVEQMALAPEIADESSIVSPHDKLREIWTEILGITDFKNSDDFFDLGGYSLHGTQMVNRIKTEFGVVIDFEDLYDYSTVDQLIPYLSTLDKVENAEESKEDTSEEYKNLLSSNQLRLWLMQQRHNISASLNIPAAFVFKNDMQIDVLKKAIQLVLDQHESLRTSFVYEEGIPQAVINENVIAKIQRISLDNVEDEQLYVLNEFNKIVTEPFELHEKSLFRVGLAEGRSNRLYVVFVIHHIVADAWSMHILFDEISKAYFHLLNGTEKPSPKLQFRHFVEKEYNDKKDSKFQAKLKNYWFDYLDGVEGLLNFNISKTNSDNIFEGSDMVQKIGGKQFTQFKEFSKQSKLSEFTLIMVAMFIAAFRKYKQNQICLGYPASIRNDERWESLIGYLVNMLVVRVDNLDKLSIEELLEIVRVDVRTGLSHKEFILTDIKDTGTVESGPLDTNPIYNAGVTWLNMPNEEEADEGATDVEELKYENTNVQYPLWLFAWADNTNSEIKLRLEFNTNIMSANEASKYLSSLKEILAEIIQNPKSKILKN